MQALYRSLFEGPLILFPSPPLLSSSSPHPLYLLLLLFVVSLLLCMCIQEPLTKWYGRIFVILIVCMIHFKNIMISDRMDVFLIFRKYTAVLGGVLDISG